MLNINETRAAFRAAVKVAIKAALDGDTTCTLYTVPNDDELNSLSFTLMRADNSNNCVQGSYYYDTDEELVLQWCK